MARKKNEPDMAFLASMLKQYGGQGADQVDVEAIKPLDDASEVTERNRQIVMLEKEAVLKHQHYRHSLMFKTCKECGATFQTNYCYVAYCSDPCRNDAFFKRYHVRWNRLRPRTEFEYEDPAVVSPEKTEALYQWAKGFVENYEAFKARTPEQAQTGLSIEEYQIQRDRMLDERLGIGEPEGSTPDTTDNPMPTGDYALQESPPEPSSNRSDYVPSLDDEVPSFSFP